MLRRFAQDRSGAVALLFAVALVPTVIVIGSALDYSRSSSAATNLQSAVDGAALAAGKYALDENRRDLAKVAREAFDAGFRAGNGVTVIRFKLNQDANKLSVEAAARVPTMFGAIIGRRTVDIDTRAEVPLGIMALEIALVLDNTGSMSRLGKMDALKQAAKSLIETIQASSGSSNSTFAVVPFNTQVNVGEANRAASWLRFSPGAAEPKLDVTSAAWTGCVVDRDQPHDARDTLPSTGRADTLYPAALCQYPGLLPVVPLTRDFAAAKAAIDAMVPTGNTNTTIGLAWGLSVLTPQAPLSGSARTPSSRVQKTIVYLTDGDNTENRWTKDRVLIDQRMEKLCQETKSAKIRVYTIRLVEGNETLLRNCASTPTMYFSVNQASELKEAFDKIAADLTTLRLSF